MLTVMLRVTTVRRLTAAPKYMLPVAFPVMRNHTLMSFVCLSAVMQDLASTGQLASWNERFAVLKVERGADDVSWSLL